YHIVRALIAVRPALPEQAHDGDRLLEHLEAELRRRPLSTEDMLVKILACAYPQEKAIRHHRCRRSGSLGDDRWMDAHRWARHAGAETESLGSVCYTANHAPHKRTMSLTVSPRMIVIRHQSEGEADCLCSLGVVDEIVRIMLLTGKSVANFTHDCRA